jgi:hypothetical protein
MPVENDPIAKHFALRNDEELRRILHSQPGEYTAEALAIARAEAAGRGGIPIPEQPMKEEKETLACARCAHPTESTFEFFHGKEIREQGTPRQGEKQPHSPKYHVDRCAVPLCDACVFQSARKNARAALQNGSLGTVICGVLTIGCTMLAGGYPQSIGSMTRDSAALRGFFFFLAMTFGIATFSAIGRTIKSVWFLILTTGPDMMNDQGNEAGENLAIELYKAKLNKNGSTHFWTRQQLLSLPSDSVAGSKPHYVEVGVLERPDHIAILEDALSSRRIDFVLEGDPNRLCLGGEGVRLMVREPQADEARKLVAELAAASSEPSSDDPADLLGEWNT